MNDTKRRAKSPLRPSASADDALVLRGKVEKLFLLRPPTTRRSRGAPSSYDRHYGAERNVVALILLTRLEAPHAAQVLLGHPDIVPICRQLARPLPASSHTSCEAPIEDVGHSSPRTAVPNQLLLYSRLVAQVITACLGEVGEYEGADAAAREYLILELGSLFTQLLGNVVVVADAGPLTALDVDLAAALAAFLPACHDSAVTDTLLRRAWDRCAAVLEQRDLTTTAAEPGSDPNDEKEPVTPDELLEATLRSILDQNSAWTVENDEHFCGNFEWWEVQTGKLFVDHGCPLRSNDSPIAPRPSFFVPMLEWWLRRRKGPKESQRVTSDYSAISSPSPWPHVLLRCIQQNPQGFEDVNHDPNLARDVLQLVLACVVNASADDNLRGQAWSALSSLVSTAGWDWMLLAARPSSSQSALGRASKLCAALRMASGEYKIQLNHRLYGSMGSAPAAERPSDRESLTEECCRILALSLRYVADVVERFDDENDTDEIQGRERATTDPKRVPLSDAAILHIRKSLHEALMNSAQYGCELTAFGADCDACVVRLLGALLSEFDVFLEGDDEKTHSILTALRAVLRVVRRDIGACESLLPGLLLIFASSEGDDDRSSVLKPYLADFVGFFEGWWAESARRCGEAGDEEGTLASRAPSIECAWNVLELWHGAVVRTGVIVEVGDIQREIVRFLSVLLEQSPDEINDDSPLVKAVSAGVSSYLALQGEDEPCEPEASTIRRAVEVLGRSNVVS